MGVKSLSSHQVLPLHSAFKTNKSKNHGRLDFDFPILDRGRSFLALLSLRANVPTLQAQVFRIPMVCLQRESTCVQVELCNVAPYNVAGLCHSLSTWSSMPNETTAFICGRVHLTRTFRETHPFQLVSKSHGAGFGSSFHGEKREIHHESYVTLHMSPLMPPKTIACT